MDYQLLADILARGDLDVLATALGPDHIEYSAAEDPQMADTVGQLVDKLSIVNNKMWYSQDIVYEIRRMSTDEFVKHWSQDLEGLHKLIKRCTDLNVQRTRLMDEIDQRLTDAITGKLSPDKLQAKQHKMY
jgi:hypothetical protein